jgi:hypothetical protein
MRGKMKDIKKKGISTRTIQTSRGPVELPVFCSAGSAVAAFFMCDYGKAAQKLEGTGLYPVEFSKGKALATLGLFEYRESTLGPYNEGFLMIAVSPQPKMSFLAKRLQFFINAKNRKLGFYTLDLPISEKLPLVAGREIWGVPKFLADISLDFSDDRFTGEVLMNAKGEKILSLESSFNKGIPFTFLDSMVYSNHQDSILKIISNFNCSVRIFKDKEARLIAGPIDHPMAHNLRDLGLDGETPFLLQSADKIQFILNDGIRVMPHTSPPLPYGD